MTERTVGALRLATMAAAATSMCILAACASSEPARSAQGTTPGSSATGKAEPAPATGETAPASGDRATRSPQEPPADTASQDPAAAPGAPAGSAAEGPGAGAPSADGASGSVTDDEIEAFVEVQLELESVRRDLMAEAKQQDADMADLQRRLEERAQELVEDSPLSLTRFQKIGQRLMRDPGLQERVRVEMEEQAGS